jgi:hypothetical protein
MHDGFSSTEQILITHGLRYRVLKIAPPRPFSMPQFNSCYGMDQPSSSGQTLGWGGGGWHLADLALDMVLAVSTHSQKWHTVASALKNNAWIQDITEALTIPVII